MFEIIEKLIEFWKNKGLSYIPTQDSVTGAATYNNFFFFKAIKDDNLSNYFIQPSTRLSDCQKGTSPIRFLKHLQFQVVIRPIPDNIRELFLESLSYLGIDGDIKFIPNDWKSEALGAQGVGWEIWCNHLEITQYTYFTHLGNQKVLPLVELAYGVERLAFILNKNLDNFFYEQDKFLSEYYENSPVEIEKFYNILEEAKSINYFAGYNKFLELNNIFNHLDLQGKLNNINRVEMINELKLLIEKISKEYKNA